MGRTSTCAGRIVHSRHAKTMLLPLPRAKADELALRNHLALASMRMGKGSLHAAQTLLEATLFAGFLAQRGVGHVDPGELTKAEKVLCDAIDRGNWIDQWSLESIDVGLLEMVVTLYDEQLRNAPLSAVAEAGDRLRSFKDGRPYGLARKR